MSAFRAGALLRGCALDHELARLHTLVHSLPRLVNRLWFPLLLILGLSLRLPLLTRFPLREDEAIYAFWALHLWRVDPLALDVWPDKPPLFLWVLGALFQLIGASEGAARLINILADTITIALVAAIGREISDPWGARYSALFYALSPFALSFAPTAYMDTTLVMWGGAALLTALRRRWFLAGLSCAAALMTKQQGLFYLPLILALLFMLPTSHKPRLRLHYLQAWASGFVVLALPILLWDSRRWSIAPSPWDLSIRNYSSLNLLPPGEWPGRMAEWSSILWHLGAGTGVWVGILLLSGLAAWRLRETSSRYHTPATLLALWSISLLSFHVITTVQVWDRYLLPLALPLALAGGCWLSASAGRRRPLRLAGLILCISLLLPPALTASRGDLPIGGDHGDYSGLTETMAWLAKEAPSDALLYHRSLGWHYRFYFFDAAASDQTAFELRWFPSVVYLTDNYAKSAHRPAFLIEPTWAELGPARRFLSMRNLELVERMHAGHFTLYELSLQ